MTAGSNSTGLSFSIDNILREDFGPQKKQLKPTTSLYYVGLPTSYGNLIYPWNYFQRLNFLGWYRPQRNIAGAEFSDAQTGPRDLQLKDSSRLQTRENEAESNEEESDEDCSSVDEANINSPTVQQGKRQRDEPSSSTEQEPKKKKPRRSQFTEMQLKYLENYFSNNSYLSRDERTVLAKALDMTELQIRNWFQNKRYHLRHKTTTTSTMTTTTSTASPTIQANTAELAGEAPVESSTKDLKESKESSTITTATLTKTIQEKTGLETPPSSSPSPSKDLVLKRNNTLEESKSQQFSLHSQL